MPKKTKKATSEKSDVISIPVPKINIWLLVSIVLAIVLVIMITSQNSQKTISKEEASRIILSFAKSQGANASVVSTAKENGLYKVTLLIDGQEAPIYLTLDGEKLVPTAISFDELNSRSQSGNQNARGSSDKKDMSQILSDEELFPSIGPKNAKDVVVEFIDFQCPFCGLASGLIPGIEKYKTRYSDLIGISKELKEKAKKGEIRYVIATMSFLGPESIYAAEAGQCANKQGKFFEMHDEIFKAQTEGENTGKFNKDKLIEIAKKVKGLDLGEFKKCLNSGETKSNVQKINDISRNFARGTPTFYLNGKQIESSKSKILGSLEQKN